MMITIQLFTTKPPKYQTISCFFRQKMESAAERLLFHDDIATSVGTRDSYHTF